MIATIEKTRINPIKLAMATDPFPDLTFVTSLWARLFVTIFRESVFLIRFVFCFVNNIKAFVCNILLKQIPKLCQDYSQIKPNSHKVNKLWHQLNKFKSIEVFTSYRLSRCLKWLPQVIISFLISFLVFSPYMWFIWKVILRSNQFRRQQ